MTQKSEIIVVVSGGLVSSVYAPNDDFECKVLDTDMIHFMGGPSPVEMLDEDMTSDELLACVDEHAEKEYLEEIKAGIDLAETLKNGLKDGSLKAIW